MRKAFLFFRRGKSLFWIIIILILGLLIFKYLDRNIRPTVNAISRIKATSVTTEAINDTIQKKMSDDISYEDIIHVKYDTNGKVSLMQANTIRMNNIAAEIALEVQNKLKEISTTSVKVPLSNAFNTQLINLPSISIDIIPQGAVSVDFATEFEASGINQTRHRVYVIVSTEIKMIVPLAGDSIKITTNIPIAETIIVGDVPEQFVNVPSDEFLNFTD